MKKRQHSSTASETTNAEASILDSTVFENEDNAAKNTPLNSNKQKKSKPDSKKQKTMSTFGKSASNETNMTSEQCIEKKLEEINNKLSKVLTKEDSSFIREIVKETVEQIKEKLLGTVLRRLEILEGSVFEQKRDIEKLQNDVLEKNKQIEELKSKNEMLHTEKSTSAIHNEFENNTEQYSRRNNIRMTGVLDDQERQSSSTVTQKIISLVNEHLGIPITPSDIDIAHRLGKFKPTENRPIIIKFVRRQTKVDILRKAKQFRGTGIFVNEDLTKLNAEILASVRLKDSANVEKCWSFEGKIYALFKGNQHATQIAFADYKNWLSKPWPRKSYSESLNTYSQANSRRLTRSKN